MSPRTDIHPIPNSGQRAPLTFEYRALREDGTTELGTASAASRDVVSADLIDRGLFPLDIQAATERPQHRSAPEVGGSESGAHRARRRIPPRDLALGLHVLASLLQARLPISRALVTLPTLAPASWPPDSLTRIRDTVREGQSLGTALSTSGIEIPPLVIGIVRAGEAGGTLGQSLARAGTVMESAAATRAAIRAALMYPLILAAAGSLSVALLIGVILPRFAAIVAELGQSLPTMARVVLGAGEVIRAGAIPALIASIVLTVIWRRWLSVGGEHALASVHAVLLRLPVAGPIRWSMGSARVTGSLGALLTSGVPLALAMGHAARASGDAELARRVMGARQRVIAGERLSSAFDATRALTEGSVQLVRAGEATGDLASMLEHAARIEREWAEERVKALVRIIEPALIVVFGGVVALIAASLLQAVYSVRPVG